MEIEIKDLEKSYDNFSLKIPELKIPKGMIVGLIGENGAGKTTLIKCLLNIITNYKGIIKIEGKTKEEIDFNDIGVVLDNMFYPDVLKVKDLVTIMTSIYNNFSKEVFYQYLEKFNLPKDKQIKTLSKGMKKKLELASALAHKPKLLILDEATSGLDPVVRREVLDIFLEFMQQEDHTILISTHITSELERIADKIIFMNEGRIILNEEGDTLIEDYGVIRCGEKEYKMIDKEDIIRCYKNKYDYEILVKDKNRLENKYKDMVIDKISLDELMVLMIKGE